MEGLLHPYASMTRARHTVPKESSGTRMFQLTPARRPNRRVEPLDWLSKRHSSLSGDDDAGWMMCPKSKPVPLWCPNNGSAARSLSESAASRSYPAHADAPRGQWQERRRCCCSGDFRDVARQMRCPCLSQGFATGWMNAPGGGGMQKHTSSHPSPH